MLIPFTSGLIRTTHYDQECRQLADRHYSRRTVGAKQFSYSGRKLVLRDAAGLVVFVWIFPDEAMRMDGQQGVNCALFRNESDRRSSDIILEAERMAREKWPWAERFYTYVDPARIRSTNPGCCFKIAGWKFVGKSRAGKHLLVKHLAVPGGTCQGPQGAPGNCTAPLPDGST